MQFKPKTEKQIMDENLLPKGEARFEVLAAEDAKSKNGNEMIHMELRLRSGERQTLAHDYLLEKMAFKLRHFCEATGLIAAYDSGRLTASQCVGKRGKCKIDVDSKGGYDPRNVVKDYLVPDGTVPADDAPPPVDDTDHGKPDDDDIPW